jgi:hypothetical protein
MVGDMAAEAVKLLAPEPLPLPVTVGEKLTVAVAWLLLWPEADTEGQPELLSEAERGAEAVGVRLPEAQAEPRPD